MSERIRRVNSVIMHELTGMINHQVDFKPGLFATVSKVDTSSDLSYTQVFVRVYPSMEKDYAMKTLAHEKYKLQKVLHKKLHLKVLPKLSFVYDHAGEDADQLEEAIKQEQF